MPGRDKPGPIGKQNRKAQHVGEEHEGRADGDEARKPRAETYSVGTSPSGRNSPPERPGSSREPATDASETGASVKRGAEKVGARKGGGKRLGARPKH